MRRTPAPAEASLPLGDVFELIRLVWAIDHGLQSTSKRMELTLGITGPQRLVIRLLGRFPGVTAGQLAEVLRVHPSTVTGILKRLQRRGLISRRLDPADARRVFLGLTPAGRKLDVASGGTVESAIEEALRGIPAPRIAAARAVLTSIAEALGKELPTTDEPAATRRRRRRA